MAASPSSNPFVLPGLGQTGDMASNPLFASLEMMRQTFASLSGANGLASGLSLQPTLDPAELEKKINELKSVESWLKLNLSMLSSTIQGMEVQLATVTTLRQFVASNHLAAQNFAAAATSAPEEKKVSPDPVQRESSTSGDKSYASSDKESPSAGKGQSDPTTSPDAAQAWWNMLTQQFGQIAAATTASMNAAHTAAKAPDENVAARGRTSESMSSSNKSSAAKTSGKSEVKRAAVRKSAAKKSTTRQPSKKVET